MAFGYVVGDAGPDKKVAGGAIAFAAALAERPFDEAAHVRGCPACQLLGRFGCVGEVPTPISEGGEKWLVEQLPEDPDAPEHLVLGEQLLLAGAGLVDVEAREDAPLHELPVEVDLRVAGPLELLEDDLVHARPGVDERGGDDGE